MEEDGVQPMDVEYVPEQLDVKGPALEGFSSVFARFQPPPESAFVRSSHNIYPFLTDTVVAACSRPRASERRDHLL